MREIQVDKLLADHGDGLSEPDIIMNISGGKDSTFMAWYCQKMNIPVDRYVYVDTTLELPIVYSWLEELEERFGIEILRVMPRHEFDDLFYRIRKRGKLKGHIRGFPGWRCHCWVSRDMKFAASLDNIWLDATRLIAICYDEDRPIEPRVQGIKRRYPLVEDRITQAYVVMRLKREGLFPPIYQLHERYGATSHRSGCYICPFVSVSTARMIFWEFSEVWQKIEQYERDAPLRWQPNNTAARLRIRFESEGKPPPPIEEMRGQI